MFPAYNRIVATSMAGGLIFLASHATVAQEPNSSEMLDWRRLFDGTTLAGWKSSRFGADGPVKVTDGAIQLGFGDPLTGVTYDGALQLPKFDYELKLRARRIDGMDFFCGLTFPYGDSHCTLILGGWGGGLIGLSSLDGRDASENETTRYETFQRNQWYDVRVLVTDGAIVAWIDERQRVICKVATRTVSTRPEVTRSRPLGIASFRTKAEIKDIAIRKLPPKQKVTNRKNTERRSSLPITSPSD